MVLVETLLLLYYREQARRARKKNASSTATSENAQRDRGLLERSARVSV